MTMLDPRPAIEAALPVADASAMFAQIRRDKNERLDKIHRYLHGKQQHPLMPSNAPQDMRRIAEKSRINIMDIVVTSVAQMMYVEGYRRLRDSENAEAWRIFQANHFDREQIGVHRAALTYGVSYLTVTPGGFGRDDSTPRMRGYSPRFMTTAYDDDPDWPKYALAIEPTEKRWLCWLYDSRRVHHFTVNQDGGDLRDEGNRVHNTGVTPVVRFQNRVDLDGDIQGEVEPLMDLQDQVDETTFNLRVTERFGAFPQRWAAGWLAPSEEVGLKASMQRLWSFEDPEVKVGQFEQADLTGYLNSRESTMRFAAVVAQIPITYLLGQMINLSAEALVAAEAGLVRKVTERQKSFGESWEQALELASQQAGLDIDEMAEVRWQDPESRALAATVDALGKMAQMLGIPVTELWEKIPGATDQDVARWRAAYERGDAFTQLQDMLGRQAQPPGGEEAA